MSLRRYQQMRDFTRTDEPRGAPPKARGAGRFVIQKHAATRLHYDFRLELDGVLKSWAVPKGPSMNPKDRRLAVHVEDHPVEYGSFEGTIPEGEYGGGTVVLWDRGQWFPEGDVHAAYKKGHLRFRLAGEKLQGGFSLVRMHGRGDDKNWLLIKSEDDAVNPDGEILVRERPESIATGRTIDDIAADPEKKVWRSNRKQPAKASRPSHSKPPEKPLKPAAPRYGHTPKPARVEPELATLVDEVPAGDDWLHEIKYDGYRLLARIDRGDVQLLTRKHEDWSARFPWLVDALRAQIPAEAALLDGEIVHQGPDGVTRFGPLQQAISTGRHDALVYYAFDLLHLQGVDVRRNPLHERKQALAALFKNIPQDGRIRLSEHIAGDGARLFGRACKLGLEGVISKKRDAPYRAGRHRDWLKVRCEKRQEVVIGGFTAARSGPRRLGALLIGVFDDAGNFKYCGKVGTGFDHDSASNLRDRLDELVTPRSPFSTTPPGFARSSFVRPEVVADVQFTEWTSDHRLRHPVFVGVREDKRAKDVRRERPVDPESPAEKPEPPVKPAAKTKSSAKKSPARAARKPAAVEVLGVPLTHPERVVYPDDAITKHDLALYYESLADWILPWISGRPLSIVRCPDGINPESGGKKQCFFQKHLPHELPPGLLTASLDADHEPFLFIKTAKGLAALAQVGVLELHAWGSTVTHPDDPDRIVLDLDPGPGVPWSRIKETAAAMRTRLADLDLDSFLKTTGGKGLHLVVPLTRGRQTWDDVKAFARGIANEFARAAPSMFTATASKAGRSGKIYIDYLRNYRGSTAIAPFSPRARPGAPVAVPLRWDELSALATPQKYTINNVLRRLTALRADPWAELPKTRQSLRATLLRDIARAA
jgi:bifunctional non-homologous end joining protein LigD